MDEIINLCEILDLNDAQTADMLRLVEVFGNDKYNEGFDAALEEAEHKKTLTNLD